MVKEGGEGNCNVRGGARGRGIPGESKRVNQNKRKREENAGKERNTEERTPEEERRDSPGEEGRGEAFLFSPSEHQREAEKSTELFEYLGNAEDEARLTDTRILPLRSRVARGGTFLKYSTATIIIFQLSESSERPSAPCPSLPARRLMHCVGRPRSRQHFKELSRCNHESKSRRTALKAVAN